MALHRPQKRPGVVVENHRGSQRGFLAEQLEVICEVSVEWFVMELSAGVLWLTLEAGDDLGDVRPSHAKANTSNVPVNVFHKEPGPLDVHFRSRKDN